MRCWINLKDFLHNVYLYALSTLICKEMHCFLLNPMEIMAKSEEMESVFTKSTTSQYLHCFVCRWQYVMATALLACD
jgi:hypothetical protein